MMFAMVSMIRKLLLLAVVFAAAAPAQGETFKHQVTGLFCPQREADLREFLKDIPEVKLVSVDFKSAQIVLEYEPAKAFPRIRSDKILEHLDTQLKQASRHTFGIKPLSQIPDEKLMFVEIPIAGLDCMACSLAVYEILAKIDGVERATASFHERRATAMIDPSRTNRAALEAALTKRGVSLGKN